MLNYLRGHYTISLLKNRYFVVAFFDRIYLIKQEYYMEEESLIMRVSNFLLQFLFSVDFQRVFPETTFLHP